MPAAIEQHSLLALPPGVYSPLPTFFDQSEEIDFEAYQRHLLNVVSKGCIPVVAGSLGEAVHLTREERIALIRFVRESLDEADYTSTPIIAGVGGSSTRETLVLSQDAYKAGATAGMVIPPAYYAATLQQDTMQIEQYFVDVCRDSPIPILLYNFPANSAGQDLSVKVLQAIMKRSPNLCGVKLTCDTRLQKLPDLVKCSASLLKDNFLFLDGKMDDLPDWTELGGHGTVTGISNLAPAATVRLFNLCQQKNLSGKEAQQAKEILETLTRADDVLMPLGVRELALSMMWGIPNVPRRPLLPLSKEEVKDLARTLDELTRLEGSL